MNKKKKYKVSDLVAISEKIQKIAFNELGIDPKDFEYVTKEQIQGLIKEKGYVEDGVLYITEEAYDDMRFTLQNMISGFIFARESQAIDCYWDDELGDMMII